MSKAGIDPRTTSFEGMTNSEIYSIFKNKVGPSLKDIDETLNVKPMFTTRQAGKFARDALGINKNPLVRATLTGSGHSNFFKIFSNDIKAPYTIHGLYINYRPSGRQ